MSNEEFLKFLKKYINKLERKDFKEKLKNNYYLDRGDGNYENN